MITQSLMRQLQQQWIQQNVKVSVCPGVQYHHMRHQQRKLQIKAAAWIKINTIIVMPAVNTFLKDKAKQRPKPGCDMMERLKTSLILHR